MALHGRDSALDQLAEVRATTDTPRLLALSNVQEAVVQVACQDWRGALAALDRLGDGVELLTPRERVSALLNGGLAHLSLLELEPARAELETALRMAVELDQPGQEFKARHNLGCLEYYAGRLPEAIRLMRAADAMDIPVGRVRAQHDLALVLLEAGLLDQAREMLDRALGVAESDGHRLEEADLRLDLANCALLADDPGTARRHLDAAVTAYRSRGAVQRQRSTALLRAFVDLADGHVPGGLDRVLAPWAEVARPVTPDERLAARVHVEALLARGDVEGAGAGLVRLQRPVRQGFAAEMHDRLLAARVAAAAGDRPRARRVVRTALRRLTERQAPSQSVEIRAALALHGQRLADFDVLDALDEGRPAAVFDAVERWRAVSHRLPPVTAPTDTEAAGLLAELRRARREAAAPGDGAVVDATTVADLEWRVSQLDWAAPERGDVDPALAPVTHAAARRLLAERGEQAVVLVAQSGRQYAVTVTSRGSRLHDLGPAAEVAGLADQLTRDLRAHAYAATNPVLAQAVGRAVAQSLSSLGTRLVADLVLDDDRPLVVVPGRTLASVPWGMVPGLAGRPVTVAPSMTRWALPLLSDEHGASVAPSVVTLAGPRLLRATAESGAVAAAWRGADVTTSDHPAATSGDVRAALTEGGVVHVAAHGTHEPQNPWFSSLHVADGPVFAHELPRPVGAKHVVLSACDVGRVDPRPGDEALGLSAALLALGVQSVVAAVAPVGDEAAEGAMVAYHRRLVGGQSAATALAATIVEHPAAGAFCLYGTDWQPPRPTARPS